VASFFHLLRAGSRRCRLPISYRVALARRLQGLKFAVADGGPVMRLSLTLFKWNLLAAITRPTCAAGGNYLRCGASASSRFQGSLARRDLQRPFPCSEAGSAPGCRTNPGLPRRACAAGRPPFQPCDVLATGGHRSGRGADLQVPGSSRTSTGSASWHSPPTRWRWRCCTRPVFGGPGTAAPDERPDLVYLKLAVGTPSPRYREESVP